MIAEPIFASAEKGYSLISHELELCKKLLKTTKADIVHLDLSLGGACVEELSAINLSQMRISSKGRTNLLKILPKIRKIALEIKRTHGIDVVAIGKGSVPIRIAELTCGAYAIIYGAERTIKEGKNLFLGLPKACRTKVMEKSVMLESLVPTEHDLAGYVKDENRILEKIHLTEMPNPCARGFRFVEISLKP
jgi:hypothetical protein